MNVSPKQINLILQIIGLIVIALVVADATIIPLKREEAIITKVWSETTRPTRRSAKNISFYFAASNKAYCISENVFTKIYKDDVIVIERSVLTNSFQSYYLPQYNMSIKDGVFNTEPLGAVLLGFNAVGLILFMILDFKSNNIIGIRNSTLLLTILSFSLMLINIFFN
jgi:hypothetical protein